jgi:hypothetical protein
MICSHPIYMQKTHILVKCNSKQCIFWKMDTKLYWPGSSNRRAAVTAISMFTSALFTLRYFRPKHSTANLIAILYASLRILKPIKCWEMVPHYLYLNVRRHFGSGVTWPVAYETKFTYLIHDFKSETSPQYACWIWNCQGHLVVCFMTNYDHLCTLIQLWQYLLCINLQLEQTSK